MTANNDRFLHSLNLPYGTPSELNLDKSYPHNSRSLHSSPKNALVLDGGAVKGCFQAGAIKAVLEAGFIPDMIYGVSVGSLNGAFLVNAAGKKYIDKRNPLSIGDWKEIGSQLMDFWLNYIGTPEDMALQRGIMGSLLNNLMIRFNNLGDKAAVNKKADGMLNLDIMRGAPVKLKVGTVDSATGELVYKNISDTDFTNYLEGAFAVPATQPGKVLFDGEVQEVTLMGASINEGAENILAILCQSKNSEKAEGLFNEKNQKHLIVRPEEEMNVHLNNFTSVDIVENIMMGYEAGKRVFNSKPVSWTA